MRFEPRKAENRNRKGWAVYDTRYVCWHSAVIYSSRKRCEASCAENETYWAEIDAIVAAEDALRAEAKARAAAARVARAARLAYSRAVAASQMAFDF